MDRRAFAGGLLLGAMHGAPSARPAPDHTFRTPKGELVALSKYRGKVVSLSFILTTCPHCAHTCALLQKFYERHGAAGFQPLAMAFNPMSNLLVDDFVKSQGLTFPVFCGERKDVDAVMGFNPDHRILVPQMAVIDRKGLIQFQTLEDSDARLSKEESLWTLIQPSMAGR